MAALDNGSDDGSDLNDRGPRLVRYMGRKWWCGREM